MTTGHWRAVLGAALAGALILAFPPADARAGKYSKVESTSEPFDWSKVIPAGKSIEIKGINGHIHASRATGNEVEVQATKRWRKSDPDEVTIEVIEHEDGVTICARYPAPDGERENVCAPGREGHSHTRDNDVQVDFELRVPKGVGLIARTVNGEVEATNLDGPIEAVTVNGAVRLSTSSYASAQTVNGSIEAAFRNAAWPEAIEFSTVNGSIHLDLPAKLDADIKASTMNGGIDTDFPVTVKGRFGKGRIEGTIGKGGRRLDLETVNGSIVLRSSS